MTATRPGRPEGMTLRRYGSWIRQAEIDGGMRPGTTTDDARRIAELERKYASCGANEILKAMSAYFARELASSFSAN